MKDKSKKDLMNYESRFKRIIENAPFGYYRIGKDGKWQYVNPEWERMHGYTMKQLIGKSFELTQPEENIVSARDIVKRGLSGEVLTGEFNRLRKDDTIGYYKFNIQPVYSGDEIVAIEGFISDITEGKQAEEKFVKINERLELAMDAGEHGFWDWNLDTNDIYFSPRYYTMLDYKPGELPMKLKTWIDLMHPDDRKIIVAEVKYYVKNAQAYEVEFRLKTKGGDWKWISGRGKSYKKDKNGTPHRAIGVHVDITQRKQAEETLMQSEKKFTKAFHSNPAMIGLSDMETGRYLEVNQTFYDKLGFTPKEVIGKKASELLQIDRKSEEKRFTLLKDQNYIKNLDVVIYTKKGIPINALLNAEIIELQGIQYNFTSALDITERKQTQKKLKESYDKLHKLAIYTNLKIEEEKKNVSQKIHDGIGQLLTAIKINLSLLSKNKINNKNYFKHIDEMIAMVDTGIEQVQDISKDLRPIIMDDSGLIVAIETYVSNFIESTGITCTVFTEPQQFEIRPDLSLVIYRVFCEIMTNIIRHAKANNVVIELEKNEKYLSMNIKDNGVGILKKHILSSRSLGLIGIKERLEAWNGTMKIEGIPNIGTTLVIKTSLIKKVKV